MRVITGSAKGYGLKAPKHMHLRPTPSRVKEAIFSSLAGRIPGARILELFAGTGAFSIECLSRGASHARLVEKHRRTVKLIEENLRKTRLQDKAKIWGCDVREALESLRKKGETYDLIFADPPYSKDSASKDWLTWLLESPALPPLLRPEGVLLMEWFKKQQCPESSSLELRKQFQFGDTVVGMFVLRRVLKEAIKNS